MYLYWAAVIVLTLKENAIDVKAATTPLQPDNSLNKSEMAHLINIVRGSKTRDEKHDKSDKSDETDKKTVNYAKYDNDDIGENNGNQKKKQIIVEKYTKYDRNSDEYSKSDEKDDSAEKQARLRTKLDLINKLIAEKKLQETYGVAHSLDFNYFDIKTRDAELERKEQKQKERVRLKKNQLLNMLSQRSRNEIDAKKAFRLHFIKNPTVLEQYRKTILNKRVSYSTSSDSDESSEFDLTDRLQRRNAVFRLGKPSEQSHRDNSKLALRINKNKDDHYYKQTPRAYDNDAKEKIIVTFKELNQEDDYEKPRKNDKKQNRNKEYDLPKKDDWDAVTKTTKDNFWNEKDEKRDKYGNNNYKKDKENQYENENRYKNKNSKNDNDRNEYSKKDNNKSEYNKNDDKSYDYYKKGNQNNNKKNDNYSEKKKYDDYDSKRGEGAWNKKESKPKNDWDKPMKDENSWDNWKPPKSQEQDRKRDDWGKHDRTTRRLDSREKYKPQRTTKRYDSGEKNSHNKNDYNEKSLREREKKTTNEWDRAVASRSPAAPKANPSYVAKISEYYHPKPRNHDSREKGSGFKSFGRTSIPFVGKKNIYED